MKEFRFAGKLKFSEYLECNAAIVEKRTFFTRIIFLFIGIGAIVTGLFFAVSEYKFNFILTGTIFILYSTLISPSLFRFRIHKNWDKNPANQKPFEIKLNNNGLITKDQDNKRSQADWDRFVYYKETKNLFLIFQSPNKPLCLPKRLVQVGNITELKVFLSEYLEKNN